MRVKARWEALDEESTQIAYAKGLWKDVSCTCFR